MRILWRLVLGLGLIVLALWVIVGEQITGASADATINARLVTLRAPIAGDFDLSDRTLGGSIAKGEVVGSLRDGQVDGVRRDDLVMEVALAEAARARHAAMIVETTALIDALQARGTTFREARVAEITLRLDFARERLALLEAGGLPASFDIAPPAEAEVEREEGREPAGLAALWINATRERIAVLENELRAAAEGVFLGDGYNDAPNAEQRVAELQSELAEERALLAEAGARLAAFAQRRDAERLRTTRGGVAEITSPVDGRLWEVLEADGVNVQRGDPLLRVLDCGSTLVTASVTEEVYNSLSFGQEATFRPNGDGRSFDATVIRLAGAGAATIYRHIAVAPSGRQLQRFDVALSVPGLAAEPDLACAVGQTGRVFFDRRPLDALRRIGN